MDGSDDSVIFKLNRPNHRSLSTRGWSVCRFSRWTEPSNSSLCVSFICSKCFLRAISFFFVWLFFFPLERGMDCCDEDTKLPLLKALMTLAGRIEPITYCHHWVTTDPLQSFFCCCFSCSVIWFWIVKINWCIIQHLIRGRLLPSEWCTYISASESLTSCCNGFHFFFVLLNCICLFLCIRWWNHETILGHLLTQCC